jgi:HAE1 family hydrophobic/amphiphilic exporter-1
MDHFTFSIRRPITTAMLFMALIVFGLKSYQELSLNLLPDITYPTLTVRTKYPSAAPEEVEHLVSVRLEEAVGTVGGLVKMSSISSSGLSEIILEFDWQTDMDMASLDVREKLDRVYLPDEVEKPVILRYNPSLDPIMRFGLHGSDDLFRLRTIGEDVVKKEIEGLAGVAAVKVKGGLEEEIVIRLDEKRAASVGLSVAEIGSRLRLENVNLAGGSLREGRSEYLVRTINEFQTVADIADVVVGERRGAEIKLSDLATVERSHKEREIITRINGRESVEIEIFKEADSNTVKVADAVKGKLGIRGPPGFLERLAEKRAKARRGSDSPRKRRDVVSQLPEGIALDIIADQSEFIKKAIAEVKSTAILGGILALLVLYFFLRDFRSTAMIGLAIPISIIATFLPMFIADVSLNIMSLGGLALGLGMLVDNSIVVLESIYRCREDGDSLETAASRGVTEVRGAVIASTITTIAVFFPIVFVQGIASQIFSDLALTVTFSLFSSLLVALFLNPMLVSRRYDFSEGASEGNPGSRPGPRAAYDWIKKEWKAIPYRARSGEGIPRAAARIILGIPLGFVSFLLKAIAQAFLVALISAAYALLFVMGAIWKAVAFVAKWLSYPFLAVFTRLYSAIDVGYPHLLRAALANRVLVVAISAVLLGHCIYLVPRLGSELMPKIHEGRFGIIAEKAVGTPIELMEESIMPIEKSAGAHPLIKTVFSLIGSESSAGETSELRGSNYAQFEILLRDLGSDVYAQDKVVDSLRDELSKLPDMKIKFVESSPFTFRTPVEVELEGRDLHLLQQIGQEIEELIADVDGLRDVRLNIEKGTPEMRITFNSDKIASLGMTVNDVAEAVRRKVKGDVPTKLAREDEKIDIRVRASETDVRTLDAVKNLVVSSPGGVPLPLSAVADMSVAPGPSEIRRIDQRRVAVVSANLSGRDLGGIREDIDIRLANVALPRGYSAGMGGQFEEMERSISSLLLALLLAVFLVYAVMAAQFESLVHPLIIIFSIPLAFIGVIYSLYFLGIPASIIVFMGGIVLAGVVVNDAIVLVDYIRQLRATGLEMNEAIVKACRTRLRPVLMTTMTTVLGLTPMAIGLGEGSEIRVPLAITVIAGLLSATFLTLVVVPSIYSAVSREKRPAPESSGD